MSRWMGVFWVGLGIFLLLSSWFGKSGFLIPGININPGWIVIAMGLIRIWWWWKSEEEPRRHKLEVRAEQRQFDLEMSRAMEEQEAAAAEKEAAGADAEESKEEAAEEDAATTDEAAPPKS